MRITKNDIETIDFIKSFIEQNKCPPSLDDIAKHFNLKDRSSARARIIRLKKHGELDFNSNARSIVLNNYDYILVKKSNNSLIPAGKPAGLSNNP